MYSSRPFAAQYPGQCHICTEGISPPQQVIIINHQGRSAICHEACNGLEPVIDLVEEAKQRQREAKRQARLRRRQRDARP